MGWHECFCLASCIHPNVLLLVQEDRQGRCQQSPFRTVHKRLYLGRVVQKPTTKATDGICRLRHKRDLRDVRNANPEEFDSNRQVASLSSHAIRTGYAAHSAKSSGGSPWRKISPPFRNDDLKDGLYPFVGVQAVL
jgi:hypothetical protein